MNPALFYFGGMFLILVSFLLLNSYFEWITQKRLDTGYYASETIWMLVMGLVLWPVTLIILLLIALFYLIKRCLPKG